MLTTTDIQWSQFQQMLSNYVEHLDFCYYSWECFASIIETLNTDKTNYYMFTNLLGFIKIPGEKKEDDKLLFHSNSMYKIRCLCKMVNINQCITLFNKIDLSLSIIWYN